MTPAEVRQLTVTEIDVMHELMQEEHDRRTGTVRGADAKTQIDQLINRGADG